MTLRNALRAYYVFVLLALLAGCGAGSPGSSAEIHSGSGTASGADTTHTNTSDAPTAARPRQLAWDVPLTRIDGSSLELSEIDGYEVEVVETTTQTSETVYIADPNQTSLPLASLAPGQYTFRVRLIDIYGLPSGYSDPVSAALN